VRRSSAVAAIASCVVLALAVGGCGVQSTGINIAQTEPFDATGPSSPESASPSQNAYSVSLFLFSNVNKGPGDMITRAVPNAPTLMDLPNLLASLTTDEQTGGYTTYVPAGIVLKPTEQAHQYVISSTQPVSLLALNQLTCTMDQYWLEHPDLNSAIRPTTRLIVPGSYDTHWQDCSDGIVPNSSATPPSRTPSPGSTADTSGN
jgi:hypothetical protein